MELGRGWSIITRYYALILLVTLGAGLAALAISNVVAPTYESAAAVLVRVGETRLFSVTALPSEAWNVFPPKTITDTDSTFLKTRTLAEKVVDRLGLDQPAAQPQTTDVKTALRHWINVGTAVAKYGQYREPSPREAAIAGVQASITPVTIRESYIILVQTAAPDPDLAAAIANVASEEFVAYLREASMHDATAYREIIQRQLGVAETDLARATAALRDQKQATGVTSLDDQLRAGVSSHEDNLRLLRETDAQLADSKARLEETRKQLAGLSETTSQSTTSDTVSRQNGSSATRTETVDSNPTYRAVQTELLTLERDIQALAARRDSLAKALDSQQDATRATLNSEPLVTPAQAAVTAANNQYLKLKTEYADALLKEARGAQEARVIDRAAPPLYPTKPVRMLYLLVGLLVGLVGALLEAIGLDAWRRAHPQGQKTARRIPSPVHGEGVGDLGPQTA